MPARNGPPRAAGSALVAMSGSLPAAHEAPARMRRRTRRPRRCHPKPWIAGLAVAALLACGSADAPRSACHLPGSVGALGSVCGFANPEDLAFVPQASALLVSEMRHGEGEGGGLAWLPLAADGAPAGAPQRLWPGGAAAPDGRGDPECKAPPERFAPHGLSAAPPFRVGAPTPLAVVQHGERETIELFDLAAGALTWRGCLRLPPGVRGNDLVLQGDGSLVVSNYQPSLSGASGLFHTVRGGLGLATGEIWRRAPGGPWQPVAGTRAANPNGVALSGDGSRVYFAATGGAEVRSTPIGDGAENAELAVQGFPDNLAWSPEGELLLVTHTRGIGVVRCGLALPAPCRSPWSLLAIDPELRASRAVLRHDGSELGAATSAAVAGDWIYLGAVFGDRIGALRRTPATPH